MIDVFSLLTFLFPITQFYFILMLSYIFKHTFITRFIGSKWHHSLSRVKDVGQNQQMHALFALSSFSFSRHLWIVSTDKIHGFTVLDTFKLLLLPFDGLGAHCKLSARSPPFSDFLSSGSWELSSFTFCASAVDFLCESSVERGRSQAFSRVTEPSQASSPVS